MERYRLDNVVPVVLRYIDDLTNWYIRLSRKRFWGAAEDSPHDKACAYATLYEALVTFSKVLAPFLPFLSDALYRGLVVEAGGEGPDSVHLCDWPTVDPAVIDRDLEDAIAEVRRAVRLGRRLRERHQLKTRQPLAKLTLVHHTEGVRAGLEQHAELLKAELNVKQVEVLARGDALATVTCKANFKTLGRRYGKQMKVAAAAIEQLTPEQFAILEDGGSIEVLEEAITLQDVMVRREPRGDVVLETEGSLAVAFDSALTDALVLEGIARELTSQLQRLRKEAGLELTDRIRVTVTSEAEKLMEAIEAHREGMAADVLAETMVVETGAPVGEAITLSTVAGELLCSAEIAKA
jgi:isoleucyl-tRNA synthetase